MKLKILLLVLLTSTFSFSQTEAELVVTGKKQLAARNSTEILKTYQALVKIKPNNATYLSNLSFGYCKVGATMKDIKSQLSYYNKAKTCAAKAKKIAPKLAIAHYAYALALARENENAPTKTKINNAKEIKRECDLAIKLNPNLPGPYHILGRWHRTFAGFSAIKKGMVNTFYGGTPPGGTYKDAISMFTKAFMLEKDYPLHLYELAVTQNEVGAKKDAIKILKIALKTKIISTDTDSIEALAKCKKLLKELE